MSDFEQRLRQALGDGAADAPSDHRLADGARRRLRTRRQRLAGAGGAVAVVAVVVPAAVLGGSGGGGSTAPDEGQPGGPPDVLVSCGGSAAWPVSAMAGGIPAAVDDGEIREAFARLESEAGIDAPTAIQEVGPSAAPYVVLAVTGREVTLGVGRWTVDGPQDDAQVLTLEQTADRLQASSWGDCNNLAVALPDGRSRVEVRAPEGGVDPLTASPEVLVNEVQCTSGRDPQPFLGEPEVVEDDERVLVTLDSAEVVGAADCQGTPPVLVTLELDAPLGDRQLFDAGTWPPTRIPVAVAVSGEWRSVEAEGVQYELPPHWDQLDCSAYTHHYGPGLAGCGEGDYLTFYPEAVYDPVMGPGEILAGEEDGETLWIGYAIVGDWAVVVRTHDRQLTEDILASVRE